jgi:hypothetical protein
VSFTPGRRDGLLTVDLTKEGSPAGSQSSHIVICDDPNSLLTWEGQPVTFPNLMGYLAINRANVTVYPLQERYMAALRADFFSAKE